MIQERNVFRVDDPFRGDVVAEIPLLDAARAHTSVERAAAAQRAWAARPLEERIAVCQGFAAALERRGEVLARDVSRQMGKPIVEARAEVSTCLDRLRQLIAMAPEALAPVRLPEKPGYRRRITHEPVGVVLVIAAWNYPLLVPIGPMTAALLAGNAVLLKHAARTPLCAEHFAAAFLDAGGPANLLTPLHVDHEVIQSVIAHPAVGYVSFTGSVRGGREIYRTIAERRFIEAGLELGGKDPAYVAADADPARAAEALIDGAMYNAGQSCCAVERIYVHRENYDRFVEQATRLARAWRPGDPLDEATTLGPMALPDAPGRIEAQVDEARRFGGEVLCGGGPLQVDGKGRFFAPTVVAEAPQASALMQEETFGPVVGIAPVESDDDALRLMNDSRYGLTASIWTSDPERAEWMGARLEAGTIYLNRCDYLDPQLAWSGWRESGRGVSLSRLGFLPVTKRKSWNLRLP